MAEHDAPAGDDVRHDDLEFNPQLEPKKATAWINLLNESEDAFEDWNKHCDNIDEWYANLERLSQTKREKQFQMFWANCEVIKPSIYAQPPKVVVVPKFHDRRPVYQAASEVLERSTSVAFDLTHIDDVMKLLRDDLVLTGRGVPWCRYEGKGEGYYDTERVCIDFKHRRDFLHSISRCWYEVSWVAAASYMTRSQARDRFRPYSGDTYQDAEYRVDKEHERLGGADNRERAKFWEIWDKANRRVVWVAEGCEEILDEDDAHIELQGFFPCPQPAYGTLQRGSLVPVPDAMQYRDQMEEINELTGRIHALSKALQVKGFYPGGSPELSDAIQLALAINSPERVLVPISNWAAFGGTKEVIIWMPIVEIAQTITNLVELRKQIIDDIYQITGLSDIMRGATDARETLGAQQLKTQFGSTRIRDRQQELVRVARDLVAIVSDIICEKFDPVTIIEMSQTQLPTAAMQRQQAQQLREQLDNQIQGLAMAQENPQFQQVAQANPQLPALLQRGQQMIQTGEKAIADIVGRPNFDQVMKFLRDNRARAFVLDIETDSTIVIDENTEKQRRGEFIGVLAQLLPQLAQMIMQEPQTAEFCGEVLKFATAPFRAGRSLEGAIDGLVEQMKQKASGPRPDDPATAAGKVQLQIEQMKLEAKTRTDQAELALKAQELQMKDAHARMELQAKASIERDKLAANEQDDAARANLTNMKAMGDRERHQADMIKKSADMQAARQKADIGVRTAQLKHQDILNRAAERQSMAQFKMMQPPRPQGSPL